MSDLRALYQEMILDHSKRPRNYRVLEAANHKAEGYNPLCGDHFTVFVDVDGGRRMGGKAGTQDGRFRKPVGGFFHIGRDGIRFPG